MARYDRLAPLVAPSRDKSFPAWLVLRDLEGRDRDTDLARRARLRFLALRPVRRLLDRGVASVSADSHNAQIEAAREELGYLPVRDAERTRLARFLHHLETRDPARIIAATLEVADACVAAGLTYGAEEFALTAHDLATAHAEYRLQGVSNITLARSYRVRGAFDDADACARTAVAVARRIDHGFDLVRARAELALTFGARGQRDEGRSLLHDTLAEMRAARDSQGEALAQAHLCAYELAFGNATAALEHGWSALRNLDEVHERAALIEHVGTAFAAAGLHKAAERCFTILAQRAGDTVVRARARAAQAVQSAALGASNSFHERRSALLNDAAEWSADPRAAAFVQLELGRGCVILQDVDFARDHLRAAITLARKHALDDVLARAGVLLSALESNTIAGLLMADAEGPAAASARSLAEQLDSLPDFAPAGG